MLSFALKKASLNLRKGNMVAQLWHKETLWRTVHVHIFFKKKKLNYGGSPTSFSVIQLRLISLLLRDLKQILYQHHAEQKKIQLTRQIRTNADVPLYQIILFRPFPFLLDDNKIAK